MSRRAPETAEPTAFAGRVVAWQRAHGRHGLPWQGRDPYRVWLSEVMLQQTQVAVVLPYFERFLARFPDVAALAAAELDEVLSLWSGLGYYGRARNLHRAAVTIVEAHGGRFPADSAGLVALPGIGRSTAAAIAAFCYGERVAILDGNVKRVLSRVLAFEGDLADPRAERALWNEATGLLPEVGIESYTQGLMDLGATVCLARSPHCLLCPVRAACRAAAAGTQERYPVKSRRVARRSRSSAWLWLRSAGRVWLVQRPSRGIWAGLWSLPEFESVEAIETATAAWPGVWHAGPSFVHVLTHLDWTLRPVHGDLAPADGEAIAPMLRALWPEGRWFETSAALALGLPAPLRRRLEDGAA